jgi:DNA-directed RNA polymerase specialized sigma24 family protein
LSLNNSTSSKKNWVLTQETFDALLSWLDSDREQAGQKYEDIRRKLVKIFTSRGCPVAEDLADETINRVAKKLKEIVDGYVGNPALYFYGVANNVHLEFVRKKPAPPPPPPPPKSSDELERESECLELCMQQLSRQNRELVLAYYQEEKAAKIEYRKELAQRLDIALNALRIRAFRLRASLRECVFECLNQREIA